MNLPDSNPFNNPSLTPRIVALSVAHPGAPLDQSYIYDQVFSSRFEQVPRARDIFCNVGVNSRHALFNPALADEKSPLLQQRMKLWKQGAMELGRRTLSDVLTHSSRTQIGSFIMTSCTGYDTPSPDMLLAEEFGLPENLRRTFIGHVGCHAAFTAIKTALDSLAARPQQAALVHCTEISSVHFRDSDTSKEQIICQALFGDASAAMVIANTPDNVGPLILATHTETISEHVDYMGWSIRDDGFKMTLSPRVPIVIGEAINGFVDKLLAPLKMNIRDVKHWCLHPGGPKIIDAVGSALSLDDEQTRLSREVLAECGNCSSPTVLLILDRLLKQKRPAPGEFGVLLGFGPGLTIEGLLVQF